MTLFVRFENRHYEISDIYVMALTCVITVLVAKITTEIIHKIISKNTKENKIKLSNPRGGKIDIKISDEVELAHTILTCIADNEQYLVTSPTIKQLIFNLVKKKIKSESLIITPNLIRLLALRILIKDEPKIIKFRNALVSSSNFARLKIRVIGSSTLSLLCYMSSSLTYLVFLILLLFQETENCGYNCHDYFQQLPKTTPIEILAEQPGGHLVIAENDYTKQVEIYIPDKSSEKVNVIDSKTGEQMIKVTKNYKLSSKKAKEVKFSEFRKTDPVLSAFKEEPKVPQRPCPVSDISDVIDLSLE